MIAAIDPGRTNMGFWCGSVKSDVQTRHIIVTTRRWERLTMAKGAPAYRGAIDVVEAEIKALQEKPEMVVVETQDPRNVPARVIACSVYGYVRGLGIPVIFSDSRTKNNAIETLAQQFGIKEELLDKELAELKDDKKKRLRLLHVANKKNSVSVVKRLVRGTADESIFSKCKKQDDISDALLLAIGVWIKKDSY